MNGGQQNSPDKSPQPDAKLIGYPPSPTPLKRSMPLPRQKTGSPTQKPPSAAEHEPVEVIAEPVANTGDGDKEQAGNQDPFREAHSATEQHPVEVVSEPVASTGEENIKQSGNQDAHLAQDPTEAEVVSDPVPNPESDQTEAESSKKKERGVVVPESQDNSSGNAITHGIMSMRLLRGESSEEFEKLYKELCAKYPPQGPLEKLCLERILMYHYRLRRLWRIEAEMMEYLMDQEQDMKTAKDVSLGASVQREFNQAVSFESLQRYEAAIERQLRRAIGELLVLQKIIPQIEGNPAQVAAFLRQLG